MKIDFSPHYSLEMKDCSAKSLTALLSKLLPLLLADLYHCVLLAFAEKYLSSPEKVFHCKQCGCNEFNWKTRSGKRTVFGTKWGDIRVPQLQVRCRDCGSRVYITRQLLEMKPREKIDRRTFRELALVGALASYRCGEKICGIFGSSVSKSTIWRCVQHAGSEIEFDLDTGGLAAGMADGTGIPIQHIKKRGRELKVFAQRKAGGGIRIAGLGIGRYETDWEPVFAPGRLRLQGFKLWPLGRGVHEKSWFSQRILLMTFPKIQMISRSRKQKRSFLFLMNV